MGHGPKSMFIIISYIQFRHVLRGFEVQEVPTVHFHRPYVINAVMYSERREVNWIRMHIIFVGSWNCNWILVRCDLSILIDDHVLPFNTSMIRYTESLAWHHLRSWLVLGTSLIIHHNLKYSLFIEL